MKAIVYESYGPPSGLRLEEMPVPTPGEQEVLVKIHAASINASDWHFLRGKPYFLRLMSGLLRPKNKILGVDFSGRVEAVGEKVGRFQPGNEVFGVVNEESHNDSPNLGSFAEYACVLETQLDLKPAEMDFEKVSAVPAAAMAALQGLRRHGDVQPGQKILIHGASGGVGTFAVQIAKALGAEVTAVCSTKNIDLVRALGADHVIDYTKEDFTQTGPIFDLVLAVNGNRPLSHYVKVLKDGGKYLFAGGSPRQMFQAVFLGPWISKFSGKKIGLYVTTPNQEDLIFVKELLEQGKIKPVIDRSYPLEQVPEAIQYMEKEHAQGKIVISV